MMQKRHYIRLHNAVFYGYHGNHHEERALGARFHVDVEMETDFTAAAESDALADTVNYEAVYAIVQDIVTNSTFKLMETMAHRIAVGLLSQFAQLRSVRVNVRKPGVPIKGVIDYVEVEVFEQA
jgi:7,8-dihydroneopterin aldolase/epimerase/oxygenase